MSNETFPGVSWSPEQLAFKEQVVDFAKGLNSNLVDREQEERFPHDEWQRCGDFGLLGLPIPTELGGQGLDLLTSMLAMEALGYGCRDNGLNLAVNVQLWTVEIPILHFGSESQKARYLPRLCSGEWVGAHALTEPEAGSDIYRMATRAERKDNGYIINGKKTFITLGPRADVVIFFANLDPELGRWGLTAFLVERGTEGFYQSEPLGKMGLRTAPMGELVFEDCFLPETQRLGPEGAGASIANHALEWDRCCILSSHLGTMERQLETAVDYARTREQFGQPIGKFQAVAHRLADMKLSLEASRLLLYKAGWLKAQGKPAMLEGSLAKLFISESLAKSSMDAIRVHGGVGYLTDKEIERDLRDAVGGTIYAGTSDIQRGIIAKFLGL